MTPEQLHIYTEETYIHAQLALSNYQTLLNIVNDPNSRQSREAWMFLQSFLSHFGMVSKLLYAPSSRQKISKDRARELRSHLETDTNSALNDRDARNAVEHLDERMDNWLEAEGKGILESVYENREEYDYLDKQRWVVRRVYLISESVFITEERDGPKEMALEPIVNELRRLLEICSDKLGGINPYYVIRPAQG